MCGFNPNCSAGNIVVTFPKNQVIMNRAKFLILFLALPVFLSFAEPSQQEDGYDVVALYRATELDYDDRIVDRYGNIEEAKYILEPTSFSSGYYKVRVKKIESNLYQIIGKDIFIQTRYCYEYAYNEEAVLHITSSYGYTIGELVFID